MKSMILIGESNFPLFVDSAQAGGKHIFVVGAVTILGLQVADVNRLAIPKIASFPPSLGLTAILLFDRLYIFLRVGLMLDREAAL